MQNTGCLGSSSWPSGTAARAEQTGGTEQRAHRQATHAALSRAGAAGFWFCTHRAGNRHPDLTRKALSDPTSAILPRSTGGGHRADLAPKIAETSGH